MAEAKEKEQPKADVSNILSKEENDMEKSAPKKASKPKDDKSKGGKKKHKHTHIEHHYDAEGNPKGHTVRHQGEGGETSYSAADLDEVHDGLEEHLGEPNGDEGQPPMESQQQPPVAQPGPQGV